MMNDDLQTPGPARMPDADDESGEERCAHYAVRRPIPGSTYRRYFEADLDRLTPEDAELALVFRAEDCRDVEARRSLFEDWLEGHEFTCGCCGTPFWPDAAEVTEDDEIACAECLAR